MTNFRKQYRLSKTLEGPQSRFIIREGDKDWRMSNAEDVIMSVDPITNDITNLVEFLENMQAEIDDQIANGMTFPKVFAISSLRL